MPIRILISDKIEDVCVSILKDAGFEADRKSGLDPKELEAIIGDYDGQIVRSATKVTREVLTKGKAGKLKIVGRAGAGVDNIDTIAAEELGIKVVNTPGLNSNAVAELAIAFMFILSRKLGEAIVSMKNGLWEKKSLGGFELTNKTLGLVGFGSIGKLVAKKAIGLGMKVIAYDPIVPEADIISLGAIPIKSLEEIWKDSDYVSLHLPKNKDTLNLVNAEVLSKFKKTSYLINCARGGLVDEEALLSALTEKKIAGAAFDVFSEEPPGESPLLKLPNFVSAPHLGASTLEAQSGVAEKVARLLVEYLK